MSDVLTALVDEIKAKVNALGPADKQAVLDALDDWLGEELYVPELSDEEGEGDLEDGEDADGETD